MSAVATEQNTYEIGYMTAPEGNYFFVFRNGDYLRDRSGKIRQFKTRNSARKRIARERSGQFHK